MSYYRSPRWVPPARTEAEDARAEQNDELVMAAALRGAARATEDVFPVAAPTALHHLVQRGKDPTDTEKNILGTFAWKVRTHLESAIRSGESATTLSSYRAIRDQVISCGPSRISQLPRAVPPGLAPLTTAVDVVDILEAEWRRQVGTLLDDAWAVWRPALDRRTRTPHPLVRVAFLARGSHDQWDLHTLLGLRHVTYLNDATGAFAVSALVHPNEAEDMLDGRDELHQLFRLLPSAGVSQARIDTAMRMRKGAYARGVDAPMRALVQALTAAADVLGEPVFSATPAPAQEQTLAALRHLSTQDPRAAKARPAPSARRRCSAA